MSTVDDRCTLGACPDKGVYRMVGSCSNCRVANILILQTFGHSRYTFDCPLCGCEQVRSVRLANEDEIPASPLSQTDPEGR